MSGKTAAVVGHLPTGESIEIAFFEPNPNTGFAVSVPIPLEEAQYLVSRSIKHFAAEREAILAKGVPLEEKWVRVLLSELAQDGIRPHGDIIRVDQEVLGSHAGLAKSTYRVALVPNTQGPLGFDAISAMHELTHLATEGNRYRMAVMKAGGSDLSVAGLSNGWARRKALRVKLVAGRWHFGSIDDCGSRGVFFEEATAEIVSLRWAWKHGLKGSEIPTTYAVGEKVFTLPPEFGEDVAAYGILALEQACPGVLQTLVDGARGKRDFRRLKQVIDNAFPGLFGELDELQRQSGEWAHSRGLAAGTAMILERMSVDERT